MSATDVMWVLTIAVLVVTARHVEAKRWGWATFYAGTFLWTLGNLLIRMYR